MISAEKAREITKIAQDEENAYIKAVVEKEAEAICEVIRQAAHDRKNNCEVDVRSFKYRSRVAAYLKEVLGYTAEFDPNTREIKVAW